VFRTVHRLLLLLAGSIVVLFVLRLREKLSERKGSCMTSKINFLFAEQQREKNDNLPLRNYEEILKFLLHQVGDVGRVA
jgi:hypothetical protein